MTTLINAITDAITDLILLVLREFVGRR